MRVLLDAVAIGAALAVALWLRFQLDLLAVTESSPLTGRAHVLASLIWLAGLVGALASNRLYDEDTLFPGGGEYARVLRSVVEAAAVMAGFVFVTRSFYVSRSWFGMVVGLSWVFVVAGRQGVRLFLRRSRARGHARRPAILVSRQAQSWADWRLEDIDEFAVAAALEPHDFERFAAEVEAHPERKDAFRGAAVILRARDFGHDEFWQILLIAGQLGWSVFVHSPVRSVGRDRLTLRELGGHTIVKVAPPTLTGVRALQKRALDIGASVLLLGALGPVFVVISLAVAVTSGLPIFYRQERVGRGGRSFAMLKFRTMRRNAEADTGAVWTSVDDPRRTTVGTILRRTSLDELPQLWNVLKGDMSLVGPRPERPAFVGEFAEQVLWYRFRHRMRPGMTGWAQAHGLRGNTSLDARVDHDNWYIENWSIWLDLRTLVATVREVIRGDNAY